MSINWNNHIDRLRSQIADLRNTLRVIKTKAHDERPGLEQTTAQLRELVDKNESQKTLYQFPKILHNILHNPAVGAIILGPNGEHLLFNTAAERLLGSDLMADALAEKSGNFGFYMTDKVTKYSKEHLPWQLAVQGEQVPEVDLFVRRQGYVDGLWIKATSTALKSETNDIGGAVIFLVDITEQVQVENQIQSTCDALEQQISQIGSAQLELQLLTEKLGKLDYLPEEAPNTVAAELQTSPPPTAASQAKSQSESAPKRREQSEILSYEEYTKSRADLTPEEIAVQTSSAKHRSSASMPKIENRPMEGSVQAAASTYTGAKTPASRPSKNTTEETLAPNSVADVKSNSDRSGPADLNDERNRSDVSEQPDAAGQTGASRQLDGSGQLDGFGQPGGSEQLEGSGQTEAAGHPEDSRESDASQTDSFAQTGASAESEVSRTGSFAQLEASAAPNVSAHTNDLGQAYGSTQEVSDHTDADQQIDASGETDDPSLDALDQINAFLQMHDAGKPDTSSPDASAQSDLARATGQDGNPETSSSEAPEKGEEAPPGQRRSETLEQKTKIINESIVDQLTSEILAMANQVSFESATESAAETKSAEQQFFAPDANEKQPMTPVADKSATDAAKPATSDKKQNKNATQKTTETVDPAGAKRRKILIVDDIPVNQKLLRLQLKRLGFECDAANNGDAAQKAIANGDFALVLMDLDMPIMDGFESTTAIRKSEQGQGRRIPIVAMTSYDRQEDREKCLAAGMDDFLSKGATQKQLHEVVERCMQSSPQKPATIPAEVQPQPALKETGLDIESLQKQFDKEEVQDVSRLFLSAVNTFIDCIQLGIEEKDAGAVTHFAHSVKGPCAALGIDEMTRLTSEIMSDAEAGNWTQVRVKYMKLKSSFGEVRDQLRELCTPGYV